jgi:hypothetical protein
MNTFEISNPQEIYEGDFNDMLKKGDFEVFSKSQIDSFLNDLGSILEKAEHSELDDDDKDKIEIAKAEIASFSKFTVLDNEFNKSLKYVRTRQIEWDKGEGEEIQKSDSGTYLDTNLNRSLNRVGLKYERSTLEK